MRLIFAGTPAFAAIALSALIEAGHDIALVLTQPDRPAGRGLRLEPSPVKKTAQKHLLTIEQPLTLKSPAVREMIAAAKADVMIVAAYGLILPQDILAIPPCGCINIHASLLPRWRGAAPIQRAILAGDTETGITIMQMDEGLDTGDMLLRRAIPIGADETSGELHDRLAALGAQMVNEVVREVRGARPTPVKQDNAQANYAAKISKDEAMIDWHEDAATIHRKIRAFNPSPGAVTVLAGERIKLWRAQPVALTDGAPGTVCRSPAGPLVIASGKGALNILELQRAGGKRLAAEPFLAGFPIAVGARFGHSANA
jgi:methionyl-tRNA formyltransferase